VDKYLYIYVVDRDFGFAPNPFHGYCTLATCKPLLRKVAKIGDWIMGVGGTRLKATNKCIYLMKVTEILTFNEYWSDTRFKRKKSIRNGSKVMMVGDNIYHQEGDNSLWIQEDSHHSKSDGSPNLANLKTDTSSVNVLISEHYYYFGSNALAIDCELLGYKNGRNYRKMKISNVNISTFITDIERCYSKSRNRILAYPFDFTFASKRVDQATRKIT